VPLIENVSFRNEKTPKQTITREQKKRHIKKKNLQ